MRDMRYCVHSVQGESDGDFSIRNKDGHTIARAMFRDDAYQIADDLNLAYEFKSKSEEYGLITVATKVKCELPLP